MTEADWAALITAAHRYLDSWVFVIWDNLDTHLCRRMRAFTAGHLDWRTVIQLQPATLSSPVEGVWPVMKNGLENLAAGLPRGCGTAPRSRPSWAMPPGGTVAGRRYPALLS